jgi:REP element-mobilizing transposase RayT
MESPSNADLVGRDSVEPQEEAPLKQRRHPAKGVFIFLDQATIIFVTICARHRQKVLANARVHEALLRAWAKAHLWMIGAYVIMPDHIHLFCSPTREDCVIETWITFWKREVRREIGVTAPRFQSDSFHHRLRGEEGYAEKWEYVRANPVRAGLVKTPEDWPYQGVVHELRY